MATVSEADARRQFSELLRAVKTGRSVVITSHGKPVAKIVPVVEDERTTERARSALFARLQAQQVVDADGWRRGELYDES